MTVCRVLSTGELGMSFPCVLCRKALERSHVQWTAHMGETWYSSKRGDELPESRPTNRQRRMLFGDKT
jgi:hypothetical protein